MLIDDTPEYGAVWDMVYEKLKFKPSSDYRGHSMDVPLPFQISVNYAVYCIDKMTNEQLDLTEEIIRKIFVSVTHEGQRLYVLDWQHSAFVFDPRNENEQKSITKKDDRYRNGEYNAYFPSFIPDGDYYFFIDEFFEFGYLGHPWRQEVWVFGDKLIEKIEDDKFVTFGVKGLLQASKNIRNALLFNVLSYMSEQLLTKGNTVASIDEFYLFLSNLTAVEYIRNFMKRVRKKESAVILASQNIEDFLVENVRELTKPLFSIPTHQFLFNAGIIDAGFYIDALQLEQSEFDLIRYPQRGVCLYKCGNERYCLRVIAPDHKAVMFGAVGGR